MVWRALDLCCWLGLGVGFGFNDPNNITMDKFLSNIVGGSGKKNSNISKKEGKKEQPKDAKNSWQGGTGDMESMKKKNAPVSSKMDSSKNILANAGAGINDALGKIDLFKNKSRVFESIFATILIEITSIEMDSIIHLLCNDQRVIIYAHLVIIVIVVVIIK